MFDEATQDVQRLGVAALAIRSARSLNEVLQVVTDQARELVGAHQSTTSLLVSEDWAKAVHAVSLSDKYAAWRAYDERPDGSGIYRLICQVNRPVRMPQAELEAHPAWRGFGKAASRHPPMRGWLAVPLTGRGGRNIGLIQLSDKYEDEFTEEDEAVLVKLTRLASDTIEQVRQVTRAQRRASKERRGRTSG